MLIEFYGEECGHCKNMEPLVTRLEQELSVKLQKYETWHNEQNEAMRQKYDEGRCGGVPFYINTKTGAAICGEVGYDELKSWAGGK